MRTLTASAVAIGLSAIALIGCSSMPDAVSSASKCKPLWVFLVRHGEKVGLSEDPELSPAGRQRAAVLASTLRSVAIEYVHSSDFIRTRDTAAPTASDHGLEVELYDPGDLPALVERLRRTGGLHLVVGHSNTTPPLVALLGGRPGPVIDAAGEYDRLYIVAIEPHGTVTSVMMRYGRAYSPGQD